MTTQLNNNLLLGGGLISYNWILTAAHCVYRFQTITVHIGTLHRLRIRSVFSGNITRDELFIHPGYSPVGHTHDIALIHLSSVKPSILNHGHVSIINLPSVNEIGVNLIGMEGNVAGFGSTSGE